MLFSQVRPLVAVLGPTGSGKSELSLHLAEKFSGEIVNCDSIQLYRGFDIGSAKLSPEVRRGIPHHLLDVLDPGDVTTAGDYAVRAKALLCDIAARQRLPVVVGGTGFYVRALLDGLAEGPKRDTQLRQRLTEREGKCRGVLHRYLRRLDPVTARRIHANDLNKTIRAIEISLLARRPAQEVFAAGRQGIEGFAPLKLVLDPPRCALHERIRTRSQSMFANGLLDEVRRLRAEGVPDSAKPFESIGYKEALAVLRGEMDVQQAMELVEIHTRQYAKRQVTWFRREAGAERIQGFGWENPVLSLTDEIVSGYLDKIAKSQG